MNHGFWSMFHTIGWNSNIWIERLKKIACWWTSIVVALFIAQAIVFTVRAHQNYYTENLALQEQYGEFWKEKGEAIIEDFNAEAQKAFADIDQTNPVAAQAAQTAFLNENAPRYVEQAAAVISSVEKQCPSIKAQTLGQLEQFKNFLEQNLQNVESEK